MIIPGTAAPNNLSLDHSNKAVMVEADVFHICDRIKEISDRLYIVQHTNGPFSIMERCPDGVDRQALKCDELDERILKKLRYILSVPLSERLAMHEKIEAENEAKRKEDAIDEFYENVGRPMWTQLEHDGFINSRGVSYPKRGITRG